MVGLLIGFILGIIGSLIAWFVTAGYLTPKIRIRTTLEEISDPGSTINYGFAIRNLRFFRDAQDITVRVRCRLELPEPLTVNDQDLVGVFNIPVDDEWIPVIRSQRYWRQSVRKEGGEIWAQYPQTLAQLIPSWTSHQLKLPTDQYGQVDLPKILKERNGSITVVVVAYDSWSGAKGVFIKYFKEGDVVARIPHAASDSLW
jgi:hypothetical protein